jgi:hypothetical protein
MIYSRVTTVGSNPHGEVPDTYTYGPNLRARSRTFTGVPGPLGRAPDPLRRVRPCTTRSQDRTCTGPWVGPRRGSGDNTCPDPVWCRPVRLRHCSPLGRRPDAATWPTARDVIRRAEPDVRPPGYAAPTFIADKARRMSAPLTGDVPPQHLMSPVHSAGRQYAHAAECTVLIITCTGKLPLHANATQTVDIRAQGDCTGNRH